MSSPNKPTLHQVGAAWAPGTPGADPSQNRHSVESLVNDSTGNFSPFQNRSTFYEIDVILSILTITLNLLRLPKTLYLLQQ